MNTPNVKEAAAALEQRITKLRREIEDVESLCAAKRDPNVIKLIMRSYDRLREIERGRMFIPVEKTLEHAEVVGQWNERFLLTNELMKCDHIKQRKQSLLKRLSDRLREILSKKG